VVCITPVGEQALIHPWPQAFDIARMADTAPLTVEEFAQSLPDAVIFFDASGAVTFANAEARKRFGALPEGLSLRLKFRAPEMRLLLDAVVGNGVQQSIDYSETGIFERWYKVTAMAVGAARGQFVLVLRDQSEAKQLERMRADFVANASHELRTPLASINGFIETLSGPAKNDEKAREKFLGIMQQQTARMSRLIDDLLSLSRLETASTAKQDPVDVRNVVAHVVNALSPLAVENGVTIENHIADQPIMVSGDRDELIQVFQNLIENACKYGRSGGKVVLSMQPSDASASGESVRFRSRHRTTTHSAHHGALLSR
jgi:two-component system, OmpR family, phosphate regulon sensor histidine kinase PhoR